MILGDSSVKWNLDMEALPADTYMAALGSGTHIEAYYSLKSYLQNHVAPKYVILSQTTGTYYHDFLNTFLIGDVSYHYMTSQEISEGLGVLEMYPESEIGKTIDAKSVVKYYCRTPDVFGIEFVKGIIKGTYRTDVDTYEKVKATRGSYAYAATETPNDEENAAVTDGKFRYYIEKLDELCNQNDITLIIIQDPMSSSNHEAITDEWWAEFSGEMDSLKSICTVDTEIPVYDGEFFQSSNHLTSDDVKLFSSDFYEKWAYLWE